MVFLGLALAMADLPSDFVTERFDRYLDDVPNKHPAMWEIRGYVGGIIAATLVGVTLPCSRIRL